MRQTHFYICSCVAEGGVYHFVAGENGWRLEDRLACPNPMYMVIEQDRAYILLREMETVNHHGGLLVCDIAPDGILIPCGEAQSTRGLVPCHVAVRRGKVYIANYVSGNLVCMPDIVRTHQGRGIHPTRQDAAHTHFVLAHPGMDEVFCTDLGRDVIAVYDEGLNWQYDIAMPPGSGPRHLALTEDGRLLCINELDCTLSLLEKRSPHWQCVQTVPLLDRATAADTAAALRVYGQKIYASVRGADVVVTLELTADGLQRREIILCGGKSPRDILFHDGALLCANEISGTVTGLKAEQTGLAPAQVLAKVPGALCICALQRERRMSMSERKKALVTGASRGIGRAIALALARDGYDVAVHYASGEAKAREVLRLIEANGGTGSIIGGDLCDPDSAEKIMAQAGQLDALILNASVQIRNRWAQITPEEMQRQMQCNFFSSLRMMQLAALSMAEKGWGRIVTIGSVQEKKPHPDMLVYSASKAAQSNMVQSMALQLAPCGVTVNNVAPGVIYTDRNVEALSDEAYARKVIDSIPVGFYGMPEDVAGLVSLLCSEEGRYITGQNIFVDGGKSIL